MNHRDYISYRRNIQSSAFDDVSDGGDVVRTLKENQSTGKFETAYQRSLGKTLHRVMSDIVSRCYTNRTMHETQTNYRYHNFDTHCRSKRTSLIG